MGNGQFSGETLPVLSRKIKKNLGISNPRFKFETQLCYSGLSVESLLCYVSKKFQYVALTVLPGEGLWRVTRPGEAGVLHLVVSERGWVLEKDKRK